jgi:tRNA-dihydrouridine synthase B
LGWDNADGLIEFCQGAEAAGADMICIHARTYKVPYRVPANFDPVYEMKRHVGIPILGNGGIISLQDGISKLGNLDGFLIGQATFGNPWVFSESGKPPRLQDRLSVMRSHSDWLIESKGEAVGCREIRKHLLSYIKGFEGAKIFRSRLSQVASLAEVMVILDELSTLDFILDSSIEDAPVELEDTSECATCE